MAPTPTSPTPTASHLTHLPIEIILRIIPDLTPSDIFTLRLVDRAHYHLFTLDIICRQAVRDFYRDAREFIGGYGCGSGDGGEDGGQDGDGGRSRFRLPEGAGRELFDRIHLRRTRFRHSRPTRAEVLTLENHENSSQRNYIDEEGLMHTSYTGPKYFNLTIRNLNDPSEPAVSVPLSAKLEDGSGPILPAAPTTKPRDALWECFSYVKPVVAVNEGRLLFAVDYWNGVVSMASRSRSRPTSRPTECARLAVISTEKESRGQVLQIWQSNWAMCENHHSIGAVNKHYAVYKSDVAPPPIGHGGMVRINIIPLLPAKDLGRSKIVDETRLREIVRSPDPDGRIADRDALAADRDGKLFFNASRRRRTIEVYTVPDFTTTEQPTLIAKIPYQDPDMYWKINQNIHFDVCPNTNRLRDNSYFHKLPYQAKDTISFTISQHLKQVPRHSVMGVESAATFTIPSTLCGLRDLEVCMFWSLQDDGLYGFNPPPDQSPYLLPLQGFIPLTPAGGPLGFAESINNGERKLFHTMSDYRRVLNHPDEKGGDALPINMPQPLPDITPSGYYAHPYTLPHHIMETCEHDGCEDSENPMGRYKLPDSRLMNRIRLSLWDKGRKGGDRDFGGKVGGGSTIDYTYLWRSTNDWYVDLKLTGKLEYGENAVEEEKFVGVVREDGQQKMKGKQKGDEVEVACPREKITPPSSLAPPSSFLWPRAPGKSVELPPICDIIVEGMGDGWVVFTGKKLGNPNSGSTQSFIVRYD